MNLSKLYCCLFLVLIFAISSFSQSQKAVNVYIDYCKLIENSEKYIDRTFTIEAVYIVGFEKARIESLKKCGMASQLFLELEFDEKWIQNTEPKVYEKMMKLLKKQGKPPYFINKINLTITGNVFKKVSLNGSKYYYFLLTSVNSVSKVKK